jgi:hypothetical protein
MKKKDLPQDPSALNNFTKEVCYVVNGDGEYEADLSTGWNVKKEALDNAWDDIGIRIKEASQAVKDGEKSPIYYFMEKQLMDMMVLKGYTGFWGITINRHMKPSVFKKLSDAKLKIYADAFGVSVEELKNFKG